MEDSKSLKQVLDCRPLKRLLEVYNCETETGHLLPLTSWPASSFCFVFHIRTFHFPDWLWHSF